MNSQKKVKKKQPVPKKKPKPKGTAPKTKKRNTKLVLTGLFLFFVFYLANKITEAFVIIKSDDIIVKIQNLGRALLVVFKNPLPSFKQQPLLAGLVVLFLLFVLYNNHQSNKKKYREGKEHGSAAWGTPEELAPFIDPIFKNNIILSETELVRLGLMDKGYMHMNINKNILIIGSSGSGKTRFFAKPNLMQMHSSFVVTDPKGGILPECGKMLKKGGYQIKTLNLIDFDKSMHFNPLAYLKEQEEIDRYVNTLVLNCSGGDGEKESDFFSLSAEIVITALVAYVIAVEPFYRRNMGTVMDLVNMIELSEEPGWMDDVDVKFAILEKREPRSYAVRMFKKFKANGGGKTAQSILGTVHSMLKPFENDKVRELMSKDDLAIDKIGDIKTALFVIIPDTDTTFNFIVAIMYTMMFNLLCTRADNVFGGRLPNHVRFILDEFANIGKIPNFHVLISTIRSREISAAIILQTKSQLKAIYKEDNAATIVGNCDSFLFLGGKEVSTIKDISEMLGKETIDTKNTSENRGKDRSFGQSYQRAGRELMTMGEIAVMDGRKCIVQIKNCNPFFSNKFPLEKHPRYKELADYDKKNLFDVQKYMKNQGRIKVKSGDTVTVVKVD